MSVRVVPLRDVIEGHATAEEYVASVKEYVDEALGRDVPRPVSLSGNAMIGVFIGVVLAAPFWAGVAALVWWLA